MGLSLQWINGYNGGRRDVVDSQRGTGGFTAQQKLPVQTKSLTNCSTHSPFCRGSRGGKKRIEGKRGEDIPVPIGST